jgi:hypothetical protein
MHPANQDLLSLRLHPDDQPHQAPRGSDTDLGGGWKPELSRRAGVLFVSLTLGFRLAADPPASSPPPTKPPDQVLFDFRAGSRPNALPVRPSVDLARIPTQDAAVFLKRSGRVDGLEVRTGHAQPWPGITLNAPSGHWNLAPYAYLVVAVSNPEPAAVTVACRVDNPGADGVNHCVTGSLRLNARTAGTVRVELKRTRPSTLHGELFGMRGYPVVRGGPGTIDPTTITRMLVFVPKPNADHHFAIEGVRAEGAYTPPTASVDDARPFFPFIDTFGQYSHKDWPGKTHSVQELKRRRATEDRELARRPGPPGWDRFGGWAKGPKLDASGFFRAEKYHRKWWLVDPDGHLFFSQGLDCVGALGSTPISERQTWFKESPAQQAEFREFLSPARFALKGHYAGKSPACFSFAGANLSRKYGPDWRKRWTGTIQRRLRSWGLNTIGMWSDAAVRRLRRTPYVDAIHSGGRMIEGSGGYWGKFPDVFDPGFEPGLRRVMQEKVGDSVNDPWCLGYFCDNEMSWGDEVSLAVAALRSPAEQPAKRAFVADLRAAYGDIGKLDAVWGTSYASWDQLLHDRRPPDQQRAWKDLTAFYTRIAEQYFRTVRKVIKESAPHQLYLGCRFAWVNPRAAAAAARFCDVVSYNLYRRSVAEFHFNGGADVPLLIGEFHFGALDRGLFHTGLVPVTDQHARAQAYRAYLEGALRNPAFVGCHWFQYEDEPVTGRVYDGENYQIGFVDVADTPYRETIAASRAVGAELYRYRLNHPAP